MRKSDFFSNSIFRLILQRMEQDAAKLARVLAAGSYARRAHHRPCHPEGVKRPKNLLCH